MYLQKVLEALNDALSVKDYEIRSYKEQVAQLQTRIAELEAAIEKGAEQK